MRGPQPATAPSLFVARRKSFLWEFRVAVIGAKKHKRQRRERQSVTAKREKS